MNRYDSPMTDVPVILIVDDNPENLQVLGKQLQEKKFKIEFAIDGEAALYWLETTKFDLILLDINMPGISGFDVCSKIRSNPGLNNVPVIFLTADTERESILKGFELGAQDYITKPFDSRELIVRVMTHLTLKGSLEKLDRLNKSLEEKVLERTRQLHDVNEKLEKTNLKLIDLDKAKSEFLNLISHEIRTPLNGILGPLELLKEPVYPKEIGELVEILDSSVRRLERFSMNALLITRLKTTPIAIRKEQISIKTLINNIILTENEKFHSRNIDLRFRCDKKQIFVTGEKELVDYCLRNVLDNAFAFSPDNEPVEISLDLQKNHVLCEIRDHGKGFTPLVYEHVNKLFTQGEEYRDNHPGIGLPIVKMIMDSHDGELILGNHPEGGAIVKLVFPAKSTE